MDPSDKMLRLCQGKATVVRVEKGPSAVSELQKDFLQFRHCGGLEGGKEGDGWLRRLV